MALLVLLSIFQDTLGMSAGREAMGENFFSENNSIEIKGDRLSVSLVDADLDKVLREIGRKGNFEIVYKNPPDKLVTVSFKNLPMEKGLDKLLQEQNFLLTYSRTEIPEGQHPQYMISQLFLLEKSTAEAKKAAQPKAARRTPSPPPPPPPAPDFVSPPAPDPHDVPPMPEIPPDVINDILAQEPEVQEELLETLNEAMEDYPEEVSGQLRKMLDEMQKQGLTESETFQEALEEMLKAGGPPEEE